MSDKRVRLRQRAQAFRRRLRGEKRGVSPVVATLILILIAVAAAAALYLWLVVWQGNITGGIGSPHAQSTLTIGGSTSVYPFSSLAATWYEQNNSDTEISDNQGGTGAGMIAVCGGAVDIGAASSLETVSGLIASDGCPASDASTIQITTVAFDAVDVIVQAANDHGLVSISYDTLATIYAHASVAAGSTPTLNSANINGQPITTTTSLDVAPYTQYSTPATYTALEWNEIPAAVMGATVAGCAVTTENISTVAAIPGVVNGAATACTNGAIYTPQGDASSCGFTICAGPYTAIGTVKSTDSIVTVARSDPSGTTQTFEARLLVANTASTFATSWSGIGFSGCGSNNVIGDCGMTATKTGNGNPGVISVVAGNADALGYASDGLTRVSGSGVTCQGVATAACGIGLYVPGNTAAVQPSLGHTGTISAGIINGGFGLPGATTATAIGGSYGGARPFEFVSLQPYTGVGQEFVTFILDPSNNQNLASATNEVSIYQV